MSNHPLGIESEKLASRLIPDAAHPRRRTHLAGAGGGRPGKQGATMPSPSETAAYQLGLRLTQCRTLYRSCSQPGSESSYLPPGDEMFWVEHSLQALREAFLLWGTAVRAARPLLATGEGLIGECLRLWQDREQVPTEQLLQCLSEIPVEKRLNRLEDHILWMLATPDPNGENLELWFNLGRQICDGCMDWHGGPQETTRRSPEWVWVYREELDHLLEEAGTSLDELCPETDSDQDDSRLPYLDREYVMWHRVEAALVRRLAELGFATSYGRVVASGEESPPSARGGTSDRAADENQPGVATCPGGRMELRLRVDIQQRIAYLDGALVNLERDDVAKFVAALVQAKGDWISSAQFETRCPELECCRLDRLKNKIPEPIRSLIETRGAKGSRIPVGELLPPEIVSVLWPDQA